MGEMDKQAGGRVTFMPPNCTSVVSRPNTKHPGPWLAGTEGGDRPQFRIFKYALPTRQQAKRKGAPKARTGCVTCGTPPSQLLVPSLFVL
jgi:hypothetical protein